MVDQHVRGGYHRGSVSPRRFLKLVGVLVRVPVPDEQVVRMAAVKVQFPHAAQHVA